MGGLYTLALTQVGERFRGADLTRANTAFVITFQLGTIFGPPYAGAAMHLAGMSSFPLALGLPVATLAAAVWLGGRAVAVRGLP